MIPFTFRDLDHSVKLRECRKYTIFSNIQHSKTEKRDKQTPYLKVYRRLHEGLKILLFLSP